MKLLYIRKIFWNGSTEIWREGWVPSANIVLDQSQVSSNLFLMEQVPDSMRGKLDKKDNLRNFEHQGTSDIDKMIKERKETKGVSPFD